MKEKPLAQAPQAQPDDPSSQPTLRRTEEGRLLLRNKAGEWIPVKIRPCFPWTLSDRFLSLRDEENFEFALVHDLHQLTPDSQAALKAALADTRFTFRIVKVLSITQNFELRVWKVQTAQGNRSFCTKSDDWPERYDNGQIVFKDLSGDLFVLDDVDALDPRSKRLVWAYIA